MQDFFGSRFDDCVTGVGEALTVLEDRDAMVLQKDGAADARSGQFRLFPLVMTSDTCAEFIDPHSASPSILGIGSAPDVHAKVELVAFNPGDLATKEFDRATLRLDVGQDPLSSPGGLDLQWAIVAGLNLAPDGDVRPGHARHEFNSCFAGRPIEVFGGSVSLRFEVVAHSEPQWWRRVFNRLAQDDVHELVTALGFPGILPQAVRVIDTAFSRLDAGTPLFQSARMPFALTEAARDAKAMGTPGVEVASLPEGLSLLTPQQHFASIASHRPKYWMGYGALFPGDATSADIHDIDYINPLARIPYAVLSTRLAAVKLSSEL